MFLFDWLHAILDYFLFHLKLISNRQVGWKSLNRKTKTLEREQEPILKKLKILALFNPLTEWIDTTHVMRLWLHHENIQEGKNEGTAASHKKIKSFIDFYNIDMKDFEPTDPKLFKTFEDFFIRKHKQGSRPIHAPNDATNATVVADSRVATFETVPLAKELWIKGSEFSITNLVMDVNLGARFENGSVASFRLSPQDYHRYHSPVSGTIKEFRRLPGTYYQVDPAALRSRVNILTANARDFVVIDTSEFGEVLFVAIGATNVGTVEINTHFQNPGTKICKGDELGIFQFGGSSIIVAFQEDRIEFDKDLLENSKACVQTSVEVGMSLGEATSPDRQNGGAAQMDSTTQTPSTHALGTGTSEMSFAEVAKDNRP